jgi:hypothetical protein
MTELAAHEEALLAAGYSRPGSEFDDGPSLVGHRVWIDAHGPGLVCEFQRAMVGVSSHLVRLDATGANVELKLERKGNRQLRWLLAPSSPAEPGNSSRTGGTARSSAGSSGGGSAATLALLLARPPPLPAIAPDVTGQWLCHYCFVDDVLEVAELLLQQLVVCCSAASRLLSAATPAAVRADLEGALLADRAAAVAAASEAPAERSVVALTVQRICDQFAKSKASFGGRFSSKEARSKAIDSNAELLESCRLAWPWEDRLALASWLHWAHDPPTSGDARQTSCWRGCADAEALAAHQEQCAYRPSLCPHAAHGCSAVLSLAGVERHANDCQYKPVPCTLGCGLDIPRNAMQAHINGDCGERIVQCTWCDLGCRVRIKQSALPAHEAEAAGEHLALAREALLAQQLLTADLSARNAELRSAAELSAEALVTMRAQQAAAAQQLQQQFAEMCRSERQATQESRAEAQAAAKTAKALEKEVKALRKEIGAAGGMKKELQELQRSVVAIREEAAVAARASQ